MSVTPISIVSAWLCRIWEPLTQQGVRGPVLSAVLRRCFFRAGGLLTYASRCDLQSAMLVERLANPVVVLKPHKRRRRRRPRVMSASVPLLPLRSLRHRLRALRARPALLLAELPRHGPGRCVARRWDHLSALRPRPRKACRTAARVLGSPSSQAAQRRAIHVTRRPTSYATATTWLGLRRQSTNRSLTHYRFHRARHPSTAISHPSGPTLSSSMRSTPLGLFWLSVRDNAVARGAGVHGWETSKPLIPASVTLAITYLLAVCPQ
jgi:hypothetical protein